jgi:hypothetical protein
LAIAKVDLEANYFGAKKQRQALEAFFK